MKKTSYLAAGIVSVLLAGLAFAANENKVAGCCAKAQAGGKTCTHKCCVEAAKEGNNCVKCKGSGKIETQTQAKK